MMTFVQRKKILLASTNKGKLSEISLLLGNEFTILLLTDVIPEIPEYIETGKSFAENAESKALHFHRLTGIPTIADDSGLCVNYLSGAPGVMSARWAGEKADDSKKNIKLLNEMKNAYRDNRRASFICCASFADGGEIVKTITGKVEGEILFQPKGSSGFGYDPVFFYPPLEKTFAEMTASEKNIHSHRGKAFRDLAAFITHYFEEH